MLFRSLAWYLRSADAAGQALSPWLPRVPLGPTRDGPRFTTYDDALDWCERERPNLVHAVRQAAAHGHHETAWQLAATLWGYFRLRRHWNDWITTHQTGLASARALADPQAQAWLLNGVGSTYADLKRWDDTFRHWHDAAISVGRTGTPHNLTPRQAETRSDYLTRLLWAYQDVNAGTALSNLGHAALELGQYDEAVRYLSQALAIRDETRDRQGLAMAACFATDSERLGCDSRERGVAGR